ncbi:MAG: DUF4097 family beta strand repeat protein [Gemmatimonadaceae bacterium]|nr:DUF4097 family beta strand repeat protein [Gemmatimonadaceae bacterium]
MRHHLAALVISLAAPLGALAAQSDDGTTFRWSGAVAPGHTIRLHNMNGDIRVERGDGSQVEVVAERRVNRGNGRVVHFEARARGDGDAVVCALWGDDQRCTDDGVRGSYRSGSWRGGDQVSVTMRVRVPDGVKAYARNTNGDVVLEGLTAEVDAATTNGNVNVRTSGTIVNARTTNGSVVARLGRVEGTAPMHFASTNGSVTVYAPVTLSAELEMSTTNGGVSTELPVLVSGRVARNSLRATIGQGGRQLTLRSTNGDVALRRNGI